jgi:hypothetical protein
MTRRCSERAPQTVVSVVVAGEPSCSTTTAMRPQHEDPVVATSQVLVPHDPHQGCERARSGSRSTRGRETVEAPASGDFAPRRGRSRGPSGPAPERALEVLVVRSDGCMMSQRPAHDAEASTPHTAPPAADVAVLQPE